MNILLIFPAPERFPISVYQYRNVSIPAFLTHMAALTPKEHQVRLVDMMMGDTVPYHDRFDLVGITVRTPMAPVSYAIADRFRSMGTKVVLGGAHASALPMEAKGHADAVVIGEAEQTWEMVLEDVHTNSLRDFYVCGPFPLDTLSGDFRHVPHRPDLKDLPAPRYDRLDCSRYIMGTFFTTRGCTYGCKFCNVQPLFGARTRHRPVDQVIGELSKAPRLLLSVDDNIFGAPGDVDYYMELYGRMKKLGKYWAGQGSLAVTTYPRADGLLQTAAKSGLSLLTAGIEALDSDGLEESGAFRKLGLSAPANITTDQARESIHKIQRYGINLLGYFIIGFRRQTPATFQAILDFCDRFAIIPVPILLHPLPGTPLYEEYRAEGLLHAPHGWEAFDGAHMVVRHPEFDVADTEQKYIQTVMAANSNGRRVSRTFQRFIRNPRIDSLINFHKTQGVMQKGIREYLKERRSSP
ncbi:MAG: B12-binding domain-containing radical SAM protein [Thermodesulfobacteriota bacterium]